MIICAAKGRMVRTPYGLREKGGSKEEVEWNGGIYMQNWPYIGGARGQREDWCGLADCADELFYSQCIMAGLAQGFRPPVFASQLESGLRHVLVDDERVDSYWKWSETCRFLAVRILIEAFEAFKIRWKLAASMCWMVSVCKKPQETSDLHFAFLFSVSTSKLVENGVF